MTPSEKKPSVFDYLSVRQWLSDWIEWKKSTVMTKTRANQNRLAERAGLSASALSRLKSGKRPPTENLVEKIAPAADLSGGEQEYLHLLVRLETASGFSERAVAIQELFSTPRFRQTLTLQASQLEYLSRWQNVAIHELALLPNFQCDPDWIAQQLSFGVTAQDAEKSLEILFRLRLLTRDEQGAVHAHRLRLTTLKAFQGDEMFAYHHNFIRLAQEALNSVTHTMRYFGGATITIPFSKIKEFKSEAAFFIEKMANLADSNSSIEDRRVYQINLQLFPISSEPNTEE